MDLGVLGGVQLADWLIIIALTCPTFCRTSKNSSAFRMRFTMRLSRRLKGSL